MTNANLGLSALMEAMNQSEVTLANNAKEYELMEAATDDDVKSILQASEKSAEMDKQRLDAFIANIPETKSTDDDFTADDKLNHTLESLAVLTEEMEAMGYYE